MLEELIIFAIFGLPSIILAGGVIWQLWIYRGEIMTRMRPWLGPDIGFARDEHVRFGIEFHYVNYGSTPAVLVSERWGFSTEMPKKEQVRENITNISDPSCTLPTQKRKFSFVVDRTLIPTTPESKLYIWVVIKYEYGKNKHGEYGAITEYKKLENTDQARSTVKEEWII